MSRTKSLKKSKYQCVMTIKWLCCFWLLGRICPPLILILTLFLRISVGKLISQFVTCSYETEKYLLYSRQFSCNYITSYLSFARITFLDLHLIVTKILKWIWTELSRKLWMYLNYSLFFYAIILTLLESPTIYISMFEIIKIPAHIITVFLLLLDCFIISEHVSISKVQR